MTEGSRRDCDFRDQVAGLALHALEPDEEIGVLDHLPGCPECSALFAETEALLAALGGSVEQVQPPPSLRAAILAGAERTPQEPPPPAAEAPPSDTVERPAPVRHRRPGLLTSARARRLAAAALALVAVVAVGGLAVRAAQLTAERDAQTAQARTLAEIVTGLDQPGSRHATLATADGRVVAAVVVHDGRRTLVTSPDLGPNALDHDVYVLWGIADGTPTPLGTFDVATAGAEIRPVTAPAPGGDFPAYAISIEPGRTAPAVPTTVVASGALDA